MGSGGWVLAACAASVVLLVAAGSVDGGLAAARVGSSGASRVSANQNTTQQWTGAPQIKAQAVKSKQQRLAELHAENVWKNELVLALLPQSWQQPVRELPHAVQTWLRCWLMCMALYFGVGAVWAYYAYYAFGDKLFNPGEIPVRADIWEQIKVSFRGMPLYAMLPTITEYCVEQGWTLAYSRVGDVGLARYTLYFVLYMTSVEFFVYWQHRILHMGIGYSWLHTIHHKYNKGDQMSPFAGLAFHPLDGIMQALPYSWTLFYVPMHFLTHEMLLFFTSIWTTNIHDNLHAKIAPVMGAGYHTIHHTLYNYNYGHYFTFVDRLFGTLITPEENEERRAANRRAAEAGNKEQ